MKATLNVTILAALFCGASLAQQEPPATPPANPEPVAAPAPAPAPAPVRIIKGGAPRIYIDPASGLQSYVAAAVIKKHVPAVVTNDQSAAQFLLTGAIQKKDESTGSKVARCLFLYCAGAFGIQTVSVSLTDVQGEIIWAYTVQKADANAYRSTAEAVAKHLKKFLEQHPQ